MADGSAIAIDEAQREAHAFNPEAVAIWNARSSWTEDELEAWLRENGLPAPAARELAHRFLGQLRAAGLFHEAEAPPAVASQAGHAAANVSHYRMWKTDKRVRIPDAEIEQYIHRLCHQFASQPSENAVEFEIRPGRDGRWKIVRDGEVVEERGSAITAARELEWYMVETATHAERYFAHFHASALTRNGRTLLIPGKSGSGKSTLCLVLCTHGFELLGDDVIFMDPVSGAIHPFQRALHVHDDAIPLLQDAGFPYDPALHLPNFLEVDTLAAWRTSPSPPLSHILFVDWDEEGPVEVAPISQAEAAVAIRPFSHNLKRRLDGGWPTLQRIADHTQCVRLLRGQDLLSAAEAIRDLIDSEPPASDR